MSLTFELAEWPAPPKVKALTSTRIGGVSLGAFEALNIGQHVGDQPALVARNRELLCRSLKLPSEPIWLDQVHGTTVLELSEGSLPTAEGSLSDAEGSLSDAEGSLPTAEGSLPNADGSFTRSAGVVCAIMTADCMPVFLSDVAGREVALVHAGWRGLAAGIVEQAIAKLTADSSQILVWAGPSIGPKHFEVGLDVQAQLGGSAQCYRPHPEANKVYADLYQILAERLQVAGVRHYSHSTSCTFADQQRFFSYRRDGQCGRMASLIWIDA